MRAMFALFVACAAAWALGQEKPRDLSVFITVKPDVMITVTKLPFGADYVDIAVIDPAYPQAQLAAQIQEVGRLLNSAPRGGPQIYFYTPDPQKPDMKFLRATFTVDGIIDRDRGKVRIAPIVKAFAGAPAPHTVHGISLILSGEAATPRTIRKYATSSVRAEAVASSSPLGIEYRIELLTQDPRSIEFPEEYVQPPKNAGPPSSANRTVLILALFGAAALAGGALVYLALLRGAPQARPKPRN